MSHIWRSEDNLREPVLPFYQVGPEPCCWSTLHAFKSSKSVSYPKHLVFQEGLRTNPHPENPQPWLPVFQPGASGPSCFRVVPGASLPSWRKPGRGGGIPGGMSASESGLGRPFLGPWRWGRACLWLWAQAGLLICIYLHVCKFHLLTLAGLGKTPVQKARRDPSPRGWLPAGTSTQNLGPCFIDQSNALKSLDRTQGFFPGFPGCLVAQARSFSFLLPPPTLLGLPYSHQAHLGVVFEPLFSWLPSSLLPLPLCPWRTSLLTQHLTHCKGLFFSSLSPNPLPQSWYPRCSWEARLLPSGSYLSTPQCSR